MWPPRKAGRQRLTMEFLPLYIDVTKQLVLVVGAGEIGLRKTRLLLEAGAAVTVIGEEVDPGFSTLPQAGLIVIERAFGVLKNRWQCLLKQLDLDLVW